MRLTVVRQQIQRIWEITEISEIYRGLSQKETRMDYQTTKQTTFNLCRLITKSHETFRMADLGTFGEFVYNQEIYP